MKKWIADYKAQMWDGETREGRFGVEADTIRSAMNEAECYLQTLEEEDPEILQTVIERIEEDEEEQMKYSRVITKDIKEAEIREMVNRNLFGYLDRLEIGGDWWRVIRTGEDGIIIQKVTGLKEMAFNANGSNKYEGSDIQRYLQEEFPKEVPEWLRKEAEETGGFFLLSKEEVEEYLPREIDRIICDEDGDTDWWWTRSANRTNSYHVWYSSPSGNVSTYYASYAIRCAPGVYIKAKRDQ